MTRRALVGSLALLLAAGAWAEAPEAGKIQDAKKQLEDTLRVEILDLLDKVLGAGHGSNLSVLVVYLSGGTVTTRKTHTQPKMEDGPTWQPMNPGIRAFPAGPAPTDTQDVQEFSPIKFQKIIAITINESFKARVKELQDLIEKQFQFSKADGDRVTITAVAFAKSTVSAAAAVTQDRGLLILLMLLLAFVVFTLFLFGPIRMFMKGMVNALSESKARQFSIEMGGAAPAIAGGGVAGAAGVLAGGPPGAAALLSGGGAGAMVEGSVGAVEEGGAAGAATIVAGGGGTRVTVVRPFSFIKPSNIPNLVYLVQEERPEIIALILTYLNPDEAAELMASLPSDLQAQVALAMATVKQASSESVVRAEELIRKKLDFLIGGVERFVTILDRVDAETREEILAQLGKESPAIADRVRRELFTFDSLMELEDAALQIVLREIRTDTLAKALKGAPEELVSKVKSNISAGAQTLLAEEMELQGYVTPVQMAEERRKVMDLVRKLDKEGKIALRRGRRKAERIQRLERLTEAAGMDEEARRALPGATGGETAVALPADRRAEPETERKVSLSDYEQRGSGRALSMASLFRERAPAGGGSAGAAEERLVGASPRPAAPANQALTLYQQGMAAYQRQAYEEALSAFGACVAEEPGFWQAYQGMGNCHTALGQVTEAIDAYEQVLALNPGNEGLRQWLDDYKAKQGV